MYCNHSWSTPTPNYVEYPIPPLSITKNPDGDISETKRAIRDPLVSKRPEKFRV